MVSHQELEMHLAINIPQDKDFAKFPNEAVYFPREDLSRGRRQ